MQKDFPKPFRRQREVLYLPDTGHFVVLGAAGSGKTTLAIYRAIYLASKSMPFAGKTLILTFNNTPAAYLKHLREGLVKQLKLINLHDIQIETYHKFVRGYLKKRGKMGWGWICNPATKKIIIFKALKEIAGKYEPNAFFERGINFFEDEIDWIHGHGIESREDYVKVERTGRFGTKLSRELRPIMYEILEKYIEIRLKKKIQYDWCDIAICAHDEFERDGLDRLYRHIIVDEGQDFSPEMIRSLVAAIPDCGSLTFFGDVAQQIYGQRMSWRSAGLNISQAWRFEESYRNTGRIVRLALAISRMDFFRDIPDVVEPKSSRASGTKPTLVECGDHKRQVSTILNVVKGAKATQSVAVLFKNREQEASVSRALGSGAIRLDRDFEKWNNDDAGVYYGTFHAAKGLEFDMVIMPFLEAGNLPDQEYMESHGREECLTHDGRLLFVAVTRAKTDLILLYSESITELLPTDKTLYRIIKL